MTGHLMKDNEWEHKAERVLKHAARGPECWDCEFYQSSNADLAELPCHDAFAHFVNYGQFEPSRPFRCVPSLRGSQRTVDCVSVKRRGTGCALMH